MGAGLYMTANVPFGCPLYLSAIASNFALYANHVLTTDISSNSTSNSPSESASILAKLSAERKHAHSFVLSKKPLGTQ